MRSIRWAFNSKAWNPTQVEWILCAQCVQPEEKERIARFVFKRDAKSAMIGRLLIRKAVSESLKIPYCNIKLARTEKGKPYLQNDTTEEQKGFDFNISHQGDYVVIVTEPANQVGVDIMKLETPRSGPVEDFFHTMRRQFTSEEWKTITTPSSEKEQLKMFYRHWCLKESFVKALGIGIGFEIKRLNFQLYTKVIEQDSVITDTKVHVDNVLDNQWTFEESILDDHCVAVAQKCTKDGVCCEVAASPFIILTFDELTKASEPILEEDLEYWRTFAPKPEDPMQMNR